MGIADAARWGLVNVYAPLRGLAPWPTQTQQPYFGAAGQDVYNQQRQRYMGVYPNGGQGGSNLVNPMLAPAYSTLPDTRAGQVQRSAPVYNPYVPPEIAQHQRQDANRNILPAGPQGGQPSQFARDSAAAFRLNPYAQGQIDPYWLMRQNGQVVDANTFFWDPLNPGGPGGPRDWPTVDATAPAATGGGYGGWGWGGGGGGWGGGGYTPEWADRAARWAWGKEA